MMRHWWKRVQVRKQDFFITIRTNSTIQNNKFDLERLCDNHDLNFKINLYLSVPKVVTSTWPSACLKPGFHDRTLFVRTRTQCKHQWKPIYKNPRNLGYEIGSFITLWTESCFLKKCISWRTILSGKSILIIILKGIQGQMSMPLTLHISSVFLP